MTTSNLGLVLGPVLRLGAVWCFLILTAPAVRAGGFPDSSEYGHTVPQDSSAEITTLDKMVITATGVRRNIYETPAAVGTIDSFQIESSPSKSIDDMLQHETGVQMKRVTGIGEGIPSDIIIRGIPGALSATRTLVLVDGIPTNASGTPFLVVNQIPLEAVSSVEIVRGPQSALYGANAFSGVVNVLTKNGDGKPGGAVTLETGWPFSLAREMVLENTGIADAAVTATREGYLNATGLSEGGSERAGYLVNAGYTTVGNYLLSDSAFSRKSERTFRKTPENHDYHQVRLFCKGSYLPSENIALELHGRYLDSDLGFGKTDEILVDSSDTTRRVAYDIDMLGRTFLAAPRGRIRIGDDLHVRAEGYYRRVNAEFHNEELVSSSNWRPSHWKSHSDDWRVEVRAGYHGLKWNTPTIGIDYIRNTMFFGASTDRLTEERLKEPSDGEISNVGIYIQDEVKILDQYHAVPGVRLDIHDGFGATVSPKLNLGWSYSTSFSVHGSVGKGFRSPTLTELYMPPLRLNRDFALEPNPDLAPEYVWSFDLGAKTRPVSAVEFGVNGFYNHMTDLIVPGIDQSSGETRVSYMNSREAWSAGVETEFEIEIGQNLLVGGNYVFQQTRDEGATEQRIRLHDRLRKEGTSPRSEATEVSLDYVPAHKGGLQIRGTWTLGEFDFRAGLDELLVGRRSFQDLEHVRIAADPKTGAPPDVRYIAETGETIINPRSISLDPYARTDLHLSATRNQRWELGLNIQNLFDAGIEESRGTQLPGRLATVSVGVRF